MIRLPRAFAGFARAAAPSSRLAPRRCYSVAPDAVDPVVSKPRAPPKYRKKGPTFQERAKKVLANDNPLESLETPLPEGVMAHKTALAINGKSKKHYFLYTTLRDACRCPQCVDPHSKQRKFKTSDINFHVQPRSIQLDGDTLTVKWVRDIAHYDTEHVSTYSVRDLDRGAPIKLRSSSGLKRARFLWGNNKMTKIQHWISYNDYMHDETKFVKAMRHLALTGLLFVKDIPDSRDEVEKLATRMGPLRNTFYGPTWDVRSVPQAKNIAYTNQDLDFHMDLMYMRDPPGYQLLHCLENSSEGGESLFLDAFSVVQNMYKTRPETVAHLTELRLNYEYEHDDHIYCNQWPVFEVGPDSRPGSLDLLHVNYSPPFQGRLPKFHNFNMASKYIRSLNYFANHLKNNERIFKLKLQPGQCAIFENRRVLHARRPFDLTSGSRWLAGAYVDEDSLLSTFETSRRKYRNEWLKLEYPPTLEQEASAEEQDTAMPETEEIEDIKETEEPKEAEITETEESREAETKETGSEPASR